MNIIRRNCLLSMRRKCFSSSISSFSTSPPPVLSPSDTLKPNIISLIRKIHPDLFGSESPEVRDINLSATQQLQEVHRMITELLSDILYEELVKLTEEEKEIMMENDDSSSSSNVLEEEFKRVIKFKNISAFAVNQPFNKQYDISFYMYQTKPSSTNETPSKQLKKLKFTLKTPIQLVERGLINKNIPEITLSLLKQYGHLFKLFQLQNPWHHFIYKNTIDKSSSPGSSPVIDPLQQEIIANNKKLSQYTNLANNYYSIDELNEFKRKLTEKSYEIHQERKERIDFLSLLGEKPNQFVGTGRNWDHKQIEMKRHEDILYFHKSGHIRFHQFPPDDVLAHNMAKAKAKPSNDFLMMSYNKLKNKNENENNLSSTNIINELDEKIKNFLLKYYTEINFNIKNFSSVYFVCQYSPQDKLKKERQADYRIVHKTNPKKVQQVNENVQSIQHKVTSYKDQKDKLKKLMQDLKQDRQEKQEKRQAQDDRLTYVVFPSNFREVELLRFICNNLQASSHDVHIPKLKLNMNKK